MTNTNPEFEQNIFQIATAEEMQPPTIKAISMLLGVPTQRLYSVAKQPIPGEIYDSRVYNWDAITKFVLKRLPANVIDPESDSVDPIPCTTLEDVTKYAIKWDNHLAKESASNKRATSTSRTGTGSAKEYVKNADGNLIPVRKYKTEVGMELCFKKSKDIFTIVYQTDLSIILQKIHPVVDEQLTAMGNWTFNQKVIPFVNMEMALDSRRNEVAEVAEVAESTEEDS